MDNAIEISATYEGPIDHDKELEIFDGLKAYAAEHYPDHMIAGSRFDVSGVAPQEKRTHFLKLVPPAVVKSRYAKNGTLA
jgi:hypothetical protein